MVAEAPWQIAKSGPRSTVCRLKLDRVNESDAGQLFAVTVTEYRPGDEGLNVAAVDPSCHRYVPPGTVASKSTLVPGQMV